MSHSRLRLVFYGEVILNCASSLLYLFGGAAGIELLGVSQPSPIMVEAFRWFAVMTLVITYIMARALFSRDERALRFVLEGYLFGDILYLMALIQFVNTLGGTWTSGTVFAALITLFLALMRVAYLVLSPRNTPTPA